MQYNSSGSFAGFGAWDGTTLTIGALGSANSIAPPTSCERFGVGTSTAGTNSTVSGAYASASGDYAEVAGAEHQRERGSGAGYTCTAAASGIAIGCVVTAGANQMAVGQASFPINTVTFVGGMVAQAASGVPDCSLYVDSSTGKLTWKDASGTANPLY